MHIIASWVEAKKHTSQAWDDHGVFPPGTYTFQRLVEISRTVQGAIFIFGEDDEQWYRDDITKVTRDNVLIEYGLFTGALGLEGAIICRDGNPKQPSDLNGITYISVSEGNRAHARVEIEDWLDRLALAAPTQVAITSAQSTAQLFNKRELLGGDEILILKLVLQFGKQNDFAMTYAEIAEKYGKNNNVDIPLAKLMKRGYVQTEPGKIKACALTDLAWDWIKQSDDLMNNSAAKK